MRDSFSEGGVVLAIAPQTMTKTTVYGPVIDLAGYESITFYMALGDMTNADPADELDFMIYDSAVGTQAGGAGTALDSSALVDPTATPDNILVDTKGVALKGTANAFDNTVYKYGYLGPNRYVQVVLTSKGTANGMLGPLSVAGVLRYARKEPRTMIANE